MVRFTLLFLASIRQRVCIYPYFFDMKVEGKLVLETMDEMYRKQDIRTFMKNSYAFCMAHEKEIRRHIEMSEQGK